MRKMRFPIFVLAMAAAILPVPSFSQQSHAAEDKAAAYMVDMERKWAEGVCADNGVVAGLLADDFQGTGTDGRRFTKADELKDEKSARTARDCGLDQAKVRFFGDTVAVVYGSEHAVGKDKAQPDARVCQVWTDTWMKRGGVWQIIASQDNRVPCK